MVKWELEAKQKKKCLNLWKRYLCLEVCSKRVHAHVLARCINTTPRSQCLARNATIAHAKQTAVHHERFTMLHAANTRNKCLGTMHHRKTPSNTEKAVGVSYLELRGYRSHGELPDRHATLTPCLNLAQEHFGGRKYQTVQRAPFEKLEWQLFQHWQRAHVERRLKERETLQFRTIKNYAKHFSNIQHSFVVAARKPYRQMPSRLLNVQRRYNMQTPQRDTTGTQTSSQQFNRALPSG